MIFKIINSYGMIFGKISLKQLSVIFLTHVLGVYKKFR